MPLLIIQYAFYKLYAFFKLENDKNYNDGYKK